MEASLTAPDEYLTDAQFCQMMSVTPRTTNQWRRNNLGPAYIRVGLRRILYRRGEVNSWLASRTFRHRAAEVTGRSQAA
jgi:hypothetical protein